MTIRLATDSDEGKWHSFVARHPDVHHSHCWEWRRIISTTLGHTPHYLISEEAGEVTGILPLFHVSSRLFGASLISVPYLNGGGTLADDPIVEQSLITEAVRIAEQLKVKYLELRNRAPQTNGMTCRSHKVAMLLPLSASPEELFNSFSAKLRSQIRRPTKSGVVATVDSDPRSLKDFYAVFSKNMRDLGTPVYPQHLFESAVKNFANNAKIVIVRYEHKPIAAGITIGNGRQVEIPWASSLREYNNLSANMLLYWSAIKQACLDGYALFDFGRSSPDSGTYKFKAQWGATPLPLHWYYHGQVPDVNPKSSKFELLVNCWQKLPLPVANLLGPLISKNIP